MTSSRFGLCQSPVSVEFSSEPSYPQQNRLKNAGFSVHDGDRVNDWQFTTAVIENFADGWSPSGNSAPGSLYLKAFTDRMSGYWWQTVNVTPGEKLMVRCWVRTSGGRMLLYLTGSVRTPQGQPYLFDQRAMVTSLKSFFLAPDWIKTEYLRGPALNTWVLLQKVIDIPPGMTSLNVHIGSYFMAGEMWVDDMYAGPPQMDVTVSVKSAVDPAGGQIQRVTILASDGQVLNDSGDLPPGVNKWQRTITHLDAMKSLSVKTATGEGKQFTSGPFPPPSPAQ